MVTSDRYHVSKMNRQLVCAFMHMTCRLSSIQPRLQSWLELLRRENLSMLVGNRHTTSWGDQKLMLREVLASEAKGMASLLKEHSNSRQANGSRQLVAKMVATRISYMQKVPAALAEYMNNKAVTNAVRTMMDTESHAGTAPDSVAAAASGLIQHWEKEKAGQGSLHVVSPHQRSDRPGSGPSIDLHAAQQVQRVLFRNA